MLRVVLFYVCTSTKNVSTLKLRLRKSKSDMFHFLHYSDKFENLRNVKLSNVDDLI